MDKLKEIAKKFDVSEETVNQLFGGLERTEGRQVQFNIQELGGLGQWQINGMIMIGDMFNGSLKEKVNRICNEISQYSQTVSREKSETSEQKRAATSKGSQNGISYAYFSDENILEIAIDGKLKKYNTEGYKILGVQQSQDNYGHKLSFSHTKGTISLEDLKEI